MSIQAYRDNLLISKCCPSLNAKILEIKNSENSKDLKKIWIDCQCADHVQLLDFDAKRTPLTPFFQKDKAFPHLKVCDGVVLFSKDSQLHALFCEVKTNWDAKAVLQLRNTKLFFDYVHSVAKEWHGVNSDPQLWFAVLVKGTVPTIKGATKFAVSSIPAPSRPSQSPKDPMRLSLTHLGAGLSAERPLPITQLVKVSQ